jgi:ribonuclease T
MNECFISVDIESDGPIPGEYSMIEIGASLVWNPSVSFKINLKPISDKFDPVALAVSGLDRDWLMENGAEPEEAMSQFAAWVDGLCGEASPIYVANNEGYDWMFTHWYFIYFLGTDPFGHNGLDIRSYAMGALGKSWGDSSLKRLPSDLQLEAPLTHDGRDDSLAQGTCFRRLVRHRSEHDRLVAENAEERFARSRGIPISYGVPYWDSD